MRFSERFRTAVNNLAYTLEIVFVAGSISGFVAGGLGLRLAMRISAIMTPEGQLGTLTLAGALPLTFSLEGTALLLFIGTFSGLVGALFYMGVRRWLPKGWSWWQNGLAIGILLWLTNGAIMIEADNFEFRVFGPAGVNLAMYSSLFVWYGLLLAYIVKRLESGSRLLAGARLWLQIGIIVLALVSFAAVIVIVTSVAFRLVDNGQIPLMEIDQLFTMLVGAIGVLVAAVGSEDDSAFSVARTRTAAYIIIGLAAAAGLVINVNSILQILSVDVGSSNCS